ncbi:MAG: pirin family protein [Lysobacterales bacterium]|nr:pirin family protein [Xanthomonadales bacterium]MCP5476423.1 pirin family protein [Rhodanobacteraceae bacterium]
MSARHILKTIRGMATSDGAGVKLTRVIGSPALMELDPFLMLDEFGTDQPEDYIAGFPDHPHRGFETVTYMLDGRMRHRDNHGNSGLLVPGSVQWMSAGRGLVHSEMPEQEEGRMRGFQLWINLPARLKMSEPRYQEYGPEQIPRVEAAVGVRVKVIAGEVAGVSGPIEQPATSPVYLDLHLGEGARFEHPLPPAHNAFIYVYEGGLEVESEMATTSLSARQLGVLSAGEVLRLRSTTADTRAILVAGQPLREPVARYGPFVMNSRQEIMQAVEDFQAGRF